MFHFILLYFQEYAIIMIVKVSFTDIWDQTVCITKFNGKLNYIFIRALVRAPAEIPVKKRAFGQK